MDNISEDIEELLRVAGTEDAEQTVERLKEKFGAALLAVRSFEKVATGAGETANEQQAQTKELSSRYATQSEAICALFDGAALCASSVEPAAKTVIERLLKTERGERNFSVETGTGNIRTDDEIVALFGTHLPDDDDTGKPAEWLIRLNKPELEHRLQSLLDHMSIQRIAEEKDTDTYVQRLRNAYRRVEKDSEAEATRLSLSLEQAQVCHKQLADFFSVLTHLKRQIIGNTPDPDDPSFLKSESTTDEIRTALNRAWGLTSNGKDFAELIVDFLDHGKTNLENIASQFCHKNTVDRAVEQSVSVAYFEGIKPLFRFLPILWATIVTAITKFVLAQNTAIVIHDKTTSILIVTFLLAWGLSVFIGARNRETRMKELQDYTRKNFVALTDPSDAHADTTGPMGKLLDTLMLWKQEKALRDAIARGKTLRFPAESVDTIRHRKPLKTQSPLFDVNSSLKRENRRVRAQNLIALLIPAVLFPLVLIASKDKNNYYFSELSNGHACLLGEGRLVSTSDDTLYVSSRSDVASLLYDSDGGYQPVSFVQKAGARVISSFVPSLASDELPRDRVTGITSELDTQITPCAPGIVAEDDNGPILPEGDVENFFDFTFAAPDDLTRALDGLADAIAQASSDIDTDPDATLTSLAELKVLIQALSAHAVTGGPNSTVLPIAVAAPEIEMTTRQTGALVVAPVVSAPSQQGSSGEAAVQNIFTTNISLAGETDVQYELKNALFMPFFPDPIRGENLTSALDAFAFGQSNSAFTPPVMSGSAGGRDFFQVAVDAVRSCLLADPDAMMTLDIQGYASQSWTGNLPETVTPDEVNHSLAEGRRIGALRRLLEDLNSGELASRITVKGLSADIALSEIPLGADNQGPAQLQTVFDTQKRFADAADMFTSRDAWLSATPLTNANGRNEFEELFARTVVFQIVNVDSSICGLN